MDSTAYEIFTHAAPHRWVGAMADGDGRNAPSGHGREVVRAHWSVGSVLSVFDASRSWNLRLPLDQYPRFVVLDIPTLRSCSISRRLPHRSRKSPRSVHGVRTQRTSYRAAWYRDWEYCVSLESRNRKGLLRTANSNQPGGFPVLRCSYGPRCLHHSGGQPCPRGLNRTVSIHDPKPWRRRADERAARRFAEGVRLQLCVCL